MDLSRLSREDKEALYIKRATELQTLWENPLDGDWETVKTLSDSELEKNINDTVNQLLFEKGLAIFGVIVKLAVLVGIYIALDFLFPHLFFNGLWLIIGFVLLLAIYFNRKINAIRKATEKRLTQIEHLLKNRLHE